MRTLLIGTALALALVGCGNSDETRDLAEIEAAEQGDAAPGTADGATAASAGTPSAPSAPPIMPVEVSADAFKIGTAVGPDGSATGTKASSALSDTLHGSVPVSGRPAGTEVKIYWSYQDGSSHKEETKKVAAGMKYLTFDFSKANGMKRGRYMVQLDVNGAPAGILDVVVK